MPAPSACRHCGHDTYLHNNQRGCPHCQCAATRGEAHPVTDTQARAVVLGAGQFRHAWQNPDPAGDPLRPPRKTGQAHRAALAREADWLDEALSNAAGRGYSAQQIEGFRWAAGWVRFHAENGYPLEES